MMKTKIILIFLVLILAFSVTGCASSQKDKKIKEEAVDLVWSLVNLSCGTLGDYTKLPKDFRKNISKEHYNLLNYRDEFKDDYKIYCKKLKINKLEYGKDYYELNSLSYPEVEKFDKKIVVKYSYSYKSYFRKKDKKFELGVGDSSNVYVCIEKNDDTYKIIDVFAPITSNGEESLPSWLS